MLKSTGKEPRSDRPKEGMETNLGQLRGEKTLSEVKNRLISDPWSKQKTTLKTVNSDREVPGVEFIGRGVWLHAPHFPFPSRGLFLVTEGLPKRRGTKCKARGTQSRAGVPGSSQRIATFFKKSTQNRESYEGDRLRKKTQKMRGKISRTSSGTAGALGTISNVTKFLECKKCEQEGKGRL